MNTYYLGIDLNLPQNIKIIKLKRQFGFSGFGLFVELQLKLAQSKNYELSKNDYADLAYEFRLEEKYVKDVVENFELFEFENDKFFITEIKEKMKLIEDKKEAGRKAGLASGKARKKGKGTVVEQSFEPSLNNKGNKGKEINKENKLNKIESFFENILDVEKIIKENIIGYPNQEWFEEQAKANIKAIKENMINYFTQNKKGSKQEILDMNARFKQFLKSYSQKDFYRYKDKTQTTQNPNQQNQNQVVQIKKSDYTERELDGQIRFYRDKFPNIKLEII